MFQNVFNQACSKPASSIGETDYDEMTIANVHFSAEEVAGYVGKFARMPVCCKPG
jgi:hypothetical protein